ncbi:hypothetical protein ACLOJK_000111 [Asimina triloba]
MEMQMGVDGKTLKVELRGDEMSLSTRSCWRRRWRRWRLLLEAAVVDVTLAMMEMGVGHRVLPIVVAAVEIGRRRRDLGGLLWRTAVDLPWKTMAERSSSRSWLSVMGGEMGDGVVGWKVGQ